MFTSSLIVKTKPGFSEHVNELLEAYPELTSYGTHQENNIIVVAETKTVKEVEVLIQRLQKEIQEIWSVTPAFLHIETEADKATAQR